MKTILVVDDEKTIVDILEFNLKREGYEVLTAYDGEQAIDTALNECPDLVLLDVMLPKLDGFEVCKKIREKMTTPILMLTAREEIVDKVLGLELGADDYINKPFVVKEILARVKANLRRVGMQDNKNKANGNLLNIDGLIIDEDRYEVRKNGEIINLTIREYELLKFLAQNSERVFTREELLRSVWEYEYLGDLRTVDVTISRLREKIESKRDNVKYIFTKRGIGYYFKNVD
ncbi:response regulator [Wukongibacter baidiensis]|uniref:response regulator n=1 Tax=Wukongibacter baidiensis TaxID=1723361 RepID=UPI003D7FF100